MAAQDIIHHNGLSHIVINHAQHNKKPLKKMSSTVFFEIFIGTLLKIIIHINRKISTWLIYPSL